MTRYQPLCWTLFGGPQGIYLRHLTGMSVTCRGTPCGIEFYYNTNVPIKYRKLGRYKSSEYAQVIHFSIDGPAGEVINAIDIYLEYFDSEKVPWFYKNGALESFKVSHLYPEKTSRTNNIRFLQIEGDLATLDSKTLQQLTLWKCLSWLLPGLLSTDFIGVRSVNDRCNTYNNINHNFSTKIVLHL